MSNFLITGAGGYVGTVLVPSLLERGHSVVAIDTFWFGRELLPTHPRLTCVTMDSRLLTKEHFASVDTVIDLAALSNDPCGEALAEQTWEINHIARVRTATLAKLSGVQRYLLASSCSVYGQGLGKLHEHSSTTPLTVYAKACIATETETLSLTDSDFSVTALRFATLFGMSPRMRLDLVVNSMCYSAWKHGEITVNGGGTQVRPLLHVKDAASALIATTLEPPRNVSGQIFNVGDNQQNISINEVAERVAAHYANSRGMSISVRHSGPQDMRSYNVNFDKIGSHTSWEPVEDWHSALTEIDGFLDEYARTNTQRYHTLDWYLKKNCVVAMGEQYRLMMEKKG